MPIQDHGDWRALSPTALERAYDNVAAVPRAAEITTGWQERSARLRARSPAGLDLAYGPEPRQRLDLFGAGADGGPTLAFVHGGYWQRRSKEEFAFAAAGPLAHGINVATIGYTLAPGARLEEMEREIRAALDYLVRTLPAMGCDPSQLYLGGWSAGAHLAAMAMDHPAVRGVMAISGLYDLDPVRHLSVNEALGLDAESARRNSPRHLLRGGDIPLALVVGEAELPQMRWQSADFAAARRANGQPVQIETLPGADHFTILDAMERPDGRITDLIRRMTAP